VNLTPVSPSLKRAVAGIAVAVGLVVILGVALQLRANGMYPVAQGLLYDTNYDEGVNTAAGQLWLQGFVPYRDYLYVHPPLAVIIMGGVLVTHYVPWGDATSFVYERYAAIACGLLVILGAFALARMLGGGLSGLVAAGLLAVDGLVIQIDRRAMLEPYVNAFSVLAVLAFLTALRREGSRFRWLLAAGALAACAALVKATGAIILATILLYAAGRLIVVLVPARRQRVTNSSEDSIKARLLEMVAILAGAAAVSIPLVGYALVIAPVSFVRQVYLFQLFRPADGPPGALERFSQILGYDTSHLTLYLAGAGLAIIILRGLLRRIWDKWGLILIWTACICAVLASSRTFYPHYYVQLAVPLSVLAGGLVSRESTKSVLPSDGVIPAGRAYRIVLTAQVLVCAFAILINWGAAQTQLERAQAVASVRSTLTRDISRVLSRRTSLTGSVLNFFPAYALAASRKMVGPADGQFMIDSFGYMQYVSLGMEDDWSPNSSNPNIMDLLHGESAQSKVQEMAARADYILLEQRAGWQLNPETITAMTIGYHMVYTKGQVSLWAKN
jgi:Dolichyl-phosphate-mannose-protein mannosyltransferase